MKTLSRRRRSFPAGGPNAHFVIEDDQLSRNGFPGVTFTSAEELLLLAGVHDDRVDVLDVLSGVRVDVFGGDGNDRIRAHRVASNGELRVFGGADNDLFEMTPSSGAVSATLGGRLVMTSVRIVPRP